VVVDQKSIVVVARKNCRELGCVVHNIYPYLNMTHVALNIICITYIRTAAGKS
jgi:hypothetical protein